MSRPRSAHWLRRNEAARYPRRIIVLDSEAAIETAGAESRHRLRVAAASFDRFEPGERTPAQSERSAFLDAGELWAWVESMTARSHRTVLFAHNLAYDLRLCSGLTILPANGWRLEQFALDRHRCWARWRKAGRSLVMADTVSYFGRGLAGLIEEMGQTRGRLPRADAPLRVWLARCEQDVSALRELTLALLAWLEEEELGNWRLTGPAQASAAFRHRFLAERSLLVHSDAELLEVERRGAWTGRAEVWRHGKVKGPLFEFDWSLAYARVARDEPVPVRLRGELRRPTVAQLRALPAKLAYVAEVEVATEVECVPTAIGDRIAWPVGRFETTLWRPELELALECGAAVEVRRAWAYRTAPLLAEWASWVIGELEGANGALHPAVRACLKQWARTLIGRFGLRYPVWEELARDAEPECSLIGTVSADTGETGQWLRVGRQVLALSGVEESPDSSPSIMAYVMACQRVRLWRAMRSLPLGSLIYCDTDSLIVDRAGAECLDAAIAAGEFEGLRLKARYRAGTFHAPRQIELDREQRIAGVPKAAHRTAPGVFRAEVWESAQAALRRRRPDGAVTTIRTIRVRGSDERRSHLAGSETAPRVIGRPEAPRALERLSGARG